MAEQSSDLPSSGHSPLILIKYGGNAMKDPMLLERIVGALHELSQQGIRFVLVHGGGPFIQSVLDQYDVSSEFIGGHRKTSSEALKYIEMALKGEVNAELVRLMNKHGLRAVGLSGKDGGIVRAKKRWHIHPDTEEKIDLGQVGDVEEVDTALIELLLTNDYLPVLTCLAADAEGKGFNINADMFAGHLAGALKVDKYIIMTDVDGLYRDIEDPDSLMSELTTSEIEELMGSVIRGGMIPKVESCRIALNEGARTAHILNGTKPEQLKQYFLNHQSTGTEIKHHVLEKE